MYPVRVIEKAHRFRIRLMNKIIIGSIVIGVAGSAIARPELNAFINKPANTIPELVSQIKSDKNVADRYMRHFSMDRGEVLEYVSSLRLGTIKQGGLYTVYSVPQDGMLKAHVSFFKKGTPAFVDSEGNAILRVKCGNPFVRGPVKAYASSEVSTEVTDAASAPVGGPVAMSSTSTPVVASSTTYSVPSVESVTEIPAPSLPIKAIQTNTPAGTTQNFFGALAGAGAVVALANQNNSSPVPEPASMLIMGAGIAGLVAKRRKK
jgi:hypothetical protein